MTIPVQFQRPTFAYPGQANLTNTTKYQTASDTGAPISSVAVDGDFNYIIDSLNDLYTVFINATAGVIPGATTPSSSGKVPTTDGAGNITWTLVTSTLLAAASIGLTNFASQQGGSLISFQNDGGGVGSGPATLVAPGTAGQLLTSNGPGNAPSFQGSQFLPAGGGNMTGFLGLASFQNFGTNQFFIGNGNGASYATYNVGLNLVNGLGFINNTSGTSVGYMDFTIGKISMAAGYWQIDTNNNNQDTQCASLPANNTLMQAATSTTTCVTPANIQQSPFAAQGFCYISLGPSSATILSTAPNQVWSVSNVSTGITQINLPWTFTSVNDYLVFITVDAGTSTTAGLYSNVINKTTSGFQVTLRAATGTPPNPSNINVIIFAKSNP